MPGKRPQKQIFCHMTRKREDLEKHIQTFCKFYAGQVAKPSLGNSVCHDTCTVPRRFEVPGLVKKDDD